ncbi:hypothetical protein ACLOAU_16215 [Niabella sp. CJ426]
MKKYQNAQPFATKKIVTLISVSKSLTNFIRRNAEYTTAALVKISLIQLK